MAATRPPKVSDDTLRELHAEGLGCNEIARRVGLDGGTVSRRCKALGLKFDRAQTAMASKARLEDARARRVNLVHRLYDRAEAILARLEAEVFKTLVQTEPGVQTPTTLDFVPPSDERYLAHSVGSYLQAAARLEAIDADHDRNGELAELAVGLGAAIANAAKRDEEQADGADAAA